jgi:site-specific DNA-methyltransferase (adenine-specific)
MKKYQVKINNIDLEIIQDDDGKFIMPYLCIENWGKFGTALKPSFEPIVIARKPFKGSLVDNVIEYGVGGINIDECRVEPTQEYLNGEGNDNIKKSGNIYGFSNYDKLYIRANPNELGRFPANTILTYDQITFDEVCGGLPNTKKNGSISKRYKMNNQIYGEYGYCNTWSAYNDSGSASRYFYCAKASGKDRDEGLEKFKKEKVNDGRQTPIDNAFQRGETLRKNTHPTVKPTELMQYLVRLVTPQNGIILDPFNGSGSTGKAVMYENKERHKNYKYIGIELDKEYLDISKARIEFVKK